MEKELLHLLSESIPVVLALLAALASVYQWWNARFRTQLKADLEILKSLELLAHEESNLKIVQKHIDYTISKAYACGRKSSSTSGSKGGHVNLIDCTFSLLFFIGLLLSIYEVMTSGNNWWWILVGAFAFSCIVGIFNVFHKRSVSQKVGSQSEAPTNQEDKTETPYHPNNL